MIGYQVTISVVLIYIDCFVIYKQRRLTGHINIGSKPFANKKLAFIVMSGEKKVDQKGEKQNRSQYGESKSSLNS